MSNDTLFHELICSHIRSFGGLWEGARWKHVTFPRTDNPVQHIHISELDLDLLTPQELILVYETVVRTYYKKLT